MNKKVGGDRSSRTEAVVQYVALHLSPPLYQLTYLGAEGGGFISDI